MKIVIFAGGVGTRLWPLSRKQTPKQFEKIIGDKSTLQQTVARLQPDFKPEDIYIATGKRYQETVLEQLPNIPKENFIFEPEMRDVGPAIGLVSALLGSKFGNEPMGILWSDHLVKHIHAFKSSLHLAEDVIINKKSDFVFIAQKARFANQNMGWIELGESVEDNGEVKLYKFKRLIYRPKLDEAITFFENDNFVWNLGYFVTTPAYLNSLYQQYTPEMAERLRQIKNVWNSDQFEKTLEGIYPSLEKTSFDDLILVKMRSDSIFVISADLGWSDVGAWESLKEALSERIDENVVKGKVLLEASFDTLAFNYNDQLLVGIDLKEMLIVNTGDVILICPKTSVPKIKKLVENLVGTPHEHLT